jgi:hypothetical protein
MDAHAGSAVLSEVPEDGKKECKGDEEADVEAEAVDASKKHGE